jgi:hypothetical protein
MVCTHQTVVGNHLYSGRVLGATQPEDIIQLHPELKSEWNNIIEHYERVGLSHSKNVIWDVSLRVLEDYPNHDVSLFFFGQGTVSADCDEDWFKKTDSQRWNIVKLINCKNNFIQIAQELRLLVPKTFCFDNKAAITDLREFPYPCYFKPAISVDGAGIRRCSNLQELSLILESFGEEVPLQIQEEIAASSFLNVQYSIEASQLQRLAVTNQILDGYAHVGNSYPSEHQPWDSVEPLAQWMAQRGMKEVFAFDVAVVEHPTHTSYVPIECNPRFNGASYPTLIAKKLNIPSWSCETFKTQHRSLKNLDLKGIEFNCQSNIGVIVVNWGTVLVGKISILLAGTAQQQKELKAVLKQQL